MRKKDLLLKSIKFNKDYRTFKAGDEIVISKPIMLLVGLNGCGKSTVLDCLRTSFGIKDGSYLKDDKSKSYVTLETRGASSTRCTTTSTLAIASTPGRSATTYRDRWQRRG